MKVAISDQRAELGKIAQGDTPTWNAFNGSFQNADIEPRRLAELVQAGYAYTAQHARYRKADNFIQAEHIALDMDTGDSRSTIEVLRAEPFISQYATFIHTTPSHAEETPKARVVFALDRPVRNADKYALLMQSLVHRFQIADKACKDPARFFYGAKGCRVEWLGNVLPLEAAAQELVEPYREYLETQEQEAQERLAAREVVPAENAPAKLLTAHSQSLLDRVRNAPDGEKYVTLRNVSIAFGGYVAAGYYSEGEVESWLQDAIRANQNNVKDLRAAFDCIANSLAYGRNAPLYYTERTEPESVETAGLGDVQPPLTESQQAQVQRIIARVQREEYWRGYHAGMTQAQRERWYSHGLTDSIIDAYGLGFAGRHINEETGEILTNVLTVPFRNTAGEVVNIEYEAEDGQCEYECALTAPLFYAGIFDEDTNGPLILMDDSVTAINAYLHYGNTLLGGRAVSIAGLPRKPLTGATIEELCGREVLVVVSPDFEQSGRGLKHLRSHARFLRLPHTVNEMVRYRVGADEFGWLLKQARAI